VRFARHLGFVARTQTLAPPQSLLRAHQPAVAR
jgi:hypothetical protein